MDSSPLAPKLDPDLPDEYLHLPKNVVENIFTNSNLSPRDLALASGVSSSWRATASLAPWDTFYSQRWPVTPTDSSRAAYTSWHSLFSSRMSLARSFKGRPQLDRLTGHDSGVKVSKILPETDLLLTGSLDRRLSLWDLQTGTMLASSLQHAGTVRTLAVDDAVLVTGSSDHKIRVWKPRRDTLAEDEEDNEGQDVNLDVNQDVNQDVNLDHQQEQQHLPQHQRRQRDFPFDLGGTRTVLAGGHTGPVTSLQLTPTALFSGSWDYCVRVWDRNSTSDINSSLRCIHVLHFNDMVSDMAFKGEKLFVANGTVVTQVDAGAGGGLQVVSSLQRHDGDATITAVKVSEDERCVFYSTSEGGIYASDVREPKGWSDSSGYGRGSHGAVGTTCTMFKERLQHDVRNRVCSGGPLIHKHMVSCSSPVTGLSWDYPWLAASLQNGEVVLLNAETTLLGGYGGAIGSGSSSSSGSRFSRGSSRRSDGQQQQQWYSRVLNAGGAPGAAQCVDISGKWLVAGFESGNVASWDFSRAEEAERAAEAIRVGRSKKREERRQTASNNNNKSQQQQKKKEQQQGGGNEQARTEHKDTLYGDDPPPPRQTEQPEQQQQPAPRSGSGSGNGGGGGREGQRGGRESWHVLGMARTPTPTE